MEDRHSMSSIPLTNLLNRASEASPSGVHTNLHDPSNRNREVLAFATICLIIATTSIVARFYSRTFITKRLYVEDYLGFCAFLPYIGTAWCVLSWRNDPGFYVHNLDVVKTGINALVIAICYSLLMMLIKTAILLEWKRIFVLNQTHFTFSRINTTLMVLNLGVYGSALLATLLECSPIEKMYHPWVPGKCVDRKVRHVVDASFNLVIDIFIFMLPQRLIWSLRMSGRRKFGISIVFSIGLVVLAVATGRLYATIILDYVIDPHSPGDHSYRYSSTLLWAFAELTFLFPVFCGPAFPKLFTEEKSIVFRLVSSVRSWTGIPSRPSSQSASRSISWPRRFGDWNSRKRTYRRAGDENETVDSITELAKMHVGPLEGRKT